MPQIFTARVRFAVCAALTGAALAPTFSSAQLRQAPPPDNNQAEIITPSRSDPRPPGPAAVKRPGEVDWPAVAALIRETSERDQAYARETGAFDASRVRSPEEQQRIAANRPKGLRAVEPRQLQFEAAGVSEAARTRVPLLAPARQELVGDLRLYTNDNSYTATFDLPDGASVEATGTLMRVAVQDRETVSLRSAVRKRASRRLESIDAQYVISRHETGIDLSFSKFNAAYMVTVYCPKPASDPRCAEDDFVISLAEDLVILNAGQGGAQ